MKLIRKIFKIATMILIVSGLALPVFSTATAAAQIATNCQQWHTVQSGEYLSKIASLYGIDWHTLASMNNLSSPYVIYPGQRLCVSMKGTIPPTTPVVPSGGGDVRIYALRVKEDQNLVLQGRNLLAKNRYSVYLSKFKGTLPENILVGQVVTDQYGSFTVTFTIPKKLIDVAKIRINLDNGRKDTAENWFINTTCEGNTGGYGAPPLGISIQSIKQGESIKIIAKNIPANVTFRILMGKAGSKGDKGILVGTLRDTKGGNIKATIEIPAELSERGKIDLRLENKPLEMFTYLTFENKTSK